MTSNLSELLKKHQAEIFPLLGNEFELRNFCAINLSVYSPTLDIQAVQTYDGLNEFIQKQLKNNNAQVGVGGYLEKRALYRSSDNFKSEAVERDIHLGLDWWTEALSPIHAPLDGIVHSFQYNAANLDYGATIILQHKIENLVFYTLYGHLTLASLNDLKEGKFIKKGTAFTAIGQRHENGNWVPHLHFQIIKNMMRKKGDFPGVSSEAELDFFSKNSPNPNVFFNYKK